MRVRGLAFAAIAAAFLGCDHAGAPDGGRRSILLVVVDTLRADALSCYGASSGATPRIDALAATGVRFAAARSVASWTLPSVASLLTSRLPRQLDMLERRDDPKWRERWRQRRRVQRMSLDPDVATLAEVLRDAGYSTAAFVNQPLLAPRRGFDRGFAHWLQAVGKGRVQPRERLAPGNRQTWGDLAHARENDGLLVEAFETWLGRVSPEQPVFAWLHLLTPHRPYGPPGAVDAPRGERELRELYAVEVRAVDALVGRAVDAIRDHGGRAPPIVAFTSDHGEAFGEHGVFEHGNTLHGEVLRVPLVLAAQGLLPQGESVETLASLVDVAPTLLGLAGVPAPPSMVGESLLSASPGPDQGRPTLAEGMLYGPSEQAWVEGGWKLLVDRSRPEPFLYDLDRDPGELRDLYEREPARAEAMRRRLAAKLAEARGSRPPAPEEPVDAETRDALRALGYVDEDR